MTASCRAWVANTAWPAARPCAVAAVAAMLRDADERPPGADGPDVVRAAAVVDFGTVTFASDARYCCCSCATRAFASATIAAVTNTFLNASVIVDRFVSGSGFDRSHGPPGVYSIGAFTPAATVIFVTCAATCRTGSREEVMRAMSPEVPPRTGVVVPPDANDRIDPDACFDTASPKRRATSSRIETDRARFAGCSGIYASPPVSSSAHTRHAPARAICATCRSRRTPPFA